MVTRIIFPGVAWAGLLPTTVNGSEAGASDDRGTRTDGLVHSNRATLTCAALQGSLDRPRFGLI